MQSQDFPNLDAGWIEQTINQLSLREKIGQLFCPMMMDETLSAAEQIERYAEVVSNELETYQPGGYYLNKHYPETSRHLIELLQKKSKVPLFIAADMEAGAGGGLGGVIAPGLTHFPPAMALGATRYAPYVYQTGLLTALQAQQIGVNYIFAPVLDVNNNPENPIINVRSFGEDPKLVAEMGAAMLQGLRDGGVASCVKHFPGHGDTSTDSHLQLPRLNASRKRLNEVELYPYTQLLQEPGIDSIMTAHIAVKALEKEANLPATLSKRILTDLLRNEMGFEGLIVTDALLMGGITTVMDAAEAAVRSIEAGADWLLLPPDFPAAFDALLQAVETGRLSEERIDESVVRVLALKWELGIYIPELRHPAELMPELMMEGSKLNEALCGDAVTLIRDERKELPLELEDEISAILFCDTENFQDSQGDELSTALFERGIDSEVIPLTPGSDPGEFSWCKRVITDSEVVILGAIINVLPDKGSVDVPEAFAELVHYALQGEKLVVLIAFGSPYLFLRFPDAPLCICGYCYTPEMCEAISEVLAGLRKPNGTLPVSLK